MADYYFNDDYTEGNVSALISSNTLNYYSDKKTAGYLSECGPYLKLFGGYEKFWNSTIIYIILPFVENHFQIRILFRFIKISNWREGENFKLTIGDVDRTYPFEMDSDNLTGVLCGNKNNLGNSQILTLNFTINHTTTNLTMIFQILNQTLNDGSWGIKDLYVTYYDCFVGCDTCFGGTYADCDNCKPGFVMVEGYCLECDANCKRCKNNKTKTCDLCWPSSKDIYLLNETCVEVCPAPFYPDSNSVCNKCPELCADCVNASFCKVCSSNQSLYKEDLYTQKCLTRTGCAEIQGYYVDNSQSINKKFREKKLTFF